MTALSGPSSRSKLARSIELTLSGPPEAVIVAALQREHPPDKINAKHVYLNKRGTVKPAFLDKCEARVLKKRGVTPACLVISDARSHNYKATQKSIRNSTQCCDNVNFAMCRSHATPRTHLSDCCSVIDKHSSFHGNALARLLMASSSPTSEVGNGSGRVVVRS